ncbi:Kinesin-6 like protein [Giardia lamblia P15]|uniref:Kinesin-6 like protein n=1 Tax=Giardia intestinalis (strain P15) TaxID=658858 RepID=E1F0L4_GIAIA|nr:Kinesin-6 like protein [Giardia lamblia P15]
MGEDSGGTGRACAIKVYCRIRPIIDQETAVITGDSRSRTLILTSPGNATKCYRFDHVFDSHATQTDVFEKVAKDVIQRVLLGFNGALLAYGATFSGKTYTISGPHYSSPECGLIPRTINYLFQFFEGSNTPTFTIESYSISISFVEIYMEKLRDLLVTPSVAEGESSQDLHVYSLPVYSRSNSALPPIERTRVEISGLTKLPITSPQQAQQVLERANSNKVVASNRINQQSSRSHTILIITINYTFKTLEAPNLLHQRSSKLHIADLAGSESILRTRAEGERLTESKYINTSLLALGKIINQLSTDCHRKPAEYTTLLSKNSYALLSPCKHVSYRDSLLTRILQNCLSGDSITAILVHFNPDLYSLHESLSTLKFATRAAHVQTSPMQSESIFSENAVPGATTSSADSCASIEQDLDIYQLRTTSVYKDSSTALCISKLRSLIRTLYTNGQAAISPRELAILACVLDNTLSDEALCYEIVQCTTDQEDSISTLSSSSSIFEPNAQDIRKKLSFIVVDPQAEEIQRLLSLNIKEYIPTETFSRTVKEINTSLSQLYEKIESRDPSAFYTILANMNDVLKASYKWICIVSVLRIRINGETLLVHAILHDFLSVVEPLLRVSPPLATEKDQDGFFPLHRLMRIAPKTLDTQLFIRTLTTLLEYSPESIILEQTPDGKSLVREFIEICSVIDDEFGSAILRAFIAEEVDLMCSSSLGLNVSEKSPGRQHLISTLIELDMPMCIECVFQTMKAKLEPLMAPHLSDHVLKSCIDLLNSCSFDVLLRSCFLYDRDEILQHVLNNLGTPYRVALIIMSVGYIALSLTEGRYACAAIALQMLYDQNTGTKPNEPKSDESSYAVALRVFFSQEVHCDKKSMFAFAKGFLDKCATYPIPIHAYTQRGCTALLELLVEDFPGKRKFMCIQQVYEVLLELQQCSVPSVKEYEQILCGWDKLSPTLVRQEKLGNYDFCELCIRTLNPLAFEVMAAKLLNIDSVLGALQRFQCLFPATMEKCRQLVGSSEDWGVFFTKLKMKNDRTTDDRLGPRCN